MAKYKKKPVIIEAEQWFKIGDLGENVASFCCTLRYYLTDELRWLHDLIIVNGK